MLSDIPNNQERSQLVHYTRYLKPCSSLAELEELGSCVTLHKGDVLAKAGEVPNCCYVVKKGRIMAVEGRGTNDERIYYFNESGSMILEANMLLRKAPPVSFVALTTSVLVCIERQAVLEHISVNPHIAMDLLLSISYKFLASMEQIRELTCHNVLWKTCNLLLNFAERYGEPYDGKILIGEKISQQMIANLLGVNRVTISRVLKELRELNLIEQINGFYCIRSVEKMKRHMDFIMGSGMQ